MSAETILLLISCYCVGFLSLQFNSETKSICTLRCLQCKSKGCALEIDTPLLIWSGRDLDHETLHNTTLQQSPAQTLTSGHFHQVICHQVWTGYHLWQWMSPWKKLSAETHMTWLNLWPYFLEMVIKCTAWSMAAKLLTPCSIQFHKTCLIFNGTNELMWSALSHYDKLMTLSLCCYGSFLSGLRQNELWGWQVIVQISEEKQFLVISVSKQLSSYKCETQQRRLEKQALYNKRKSSRPLLNDKLSPKTKLQTDFLHLTIQVKMVTNPMFLNNEKESTDKASHISTAVQNKPQLSIIHNSRISLNQQLPSISTHFIVLDENQHDSVLANYGRKRLLGRLACLETPSIC